MSNRNTTLSIITLGWKTALGSWQIWTLLLLVNFLFAKLISAPFVSLIDSASMNRVMPSRVSLTYIYDLIQNDQNFSSHLLSILPITIGAYLLWTIFSTGGIINSIIHNDSKLSTFLSGGLKYFFRFLRLTIYMLFLLGLAGFISYKVVTAGEINIFQIDSEDFLIKRTIWVSICLAIVYTLLKLWNDWLKITITRQDPRFFFKQAINSITQILNIRILGVFLVNIVIALGLILLFRTIGRSIPISAILITQVIILIRLWYKIANLSSLNNLNSALNRA
jgi:hypothetical protein